MIDNEDGRFWVSSSDDSDRRLVWGALLLLATDRDGRV